MAHDPVLCKKGHSTHAWTTSQIHLVNRMWLFWPQNGDMIIFAFCLYLCLSLAGSKTENTTWEIHVLSVAVGKDSAQGCWPVEYMFSVSQVVHPQEIPEN